MDDYKTVLVPIDVFSDYSQILAKALRVAPDPKKRSSTLCGISTD